MATSRGLVNISISERKWMELSDFLWQNEKTGTTHLINPETSRTYCGYPALDLEDWRPTDTVPTLQNLPNCGTCRKAIEKVYEKRWFGEMFEVKEEDLKKIRECKKKHNVDACDQCNEKFRKGCQLLEEAQKG